MSMADAPTIWDINKKRAVMKVTVLSLCVQAGVNVSTFNRALTGEQEVRPATLAKLQHALARFHMSYGGDPGPLTVHAAYKLGLILAAFHLKADAKSVIFSDPARKATANAKWLEAARVRGLAFWIANQLCGFPQADIGRAAGVRRQSVQEAIEKLEDTTDPDMKRVMRQLEEVFW